MPRIHAADAGGLALSDPPLATTAGRRASLFLLATLLLVLSLLPTPRAAAQTTSDPSRYFSIRILDSKTNRGVPLVELRTVSNMRYWTDSAGYVAIDDPALLDRIIFFSVESHGYQFPKDGFGSAGRAVVCKPGQSVDWKINRINLAERLYRVTGEGIYRDSVLLAKPVPIEHPLLNAQVTGQDSVQSLIYNNKIFYFWGDTGRQRYPLGNFSTTGATSPLPKDGLDPDKGIDLTYFQNEEGFTRAMGKVPGTGLIWIDNVLVVDDEQGKPRMMAHYALMKDLGTRLAHGLILWNDQTQMFEHLLDWPKDSPAHPTGHAFRVKNDAGDFFYFSMPYALARVKADFKAIQDLKSYELFSCLKPGSRFSSTSLRAGAKNADLLDRDSTGKLIWSFKPDTDMVDEKRQKELLTAGLIKPEEAWFDLRDVETARPVTLHGGSIAFNEFKRKWISIAVEIGGQSSMLGETWYSESDAPHGPFRKARKVLTHDKYSFYNPRHHPFFDREGGKIIYFEGTYSHTFSRQSDPTPRYDYNQIMYKLDLSDPALSLQ